ncbi:YSC84-related protein [Thiohalophilus thiocyanatoxydans]|uniref:Lipid-binding SYLF domain-containing protein n=1 Tax=Thiohalophilus thiocyanatoxydans TaxID=381308 RepID=A0A4R8J282_9GAMM|nr:YSC84-related protein [Thiohalophilus thiocyanatoxydans]TDY03973.1 lipid-binding SYLF domain-containing protein [Thiohalophilus thiocyanatoxydans]
MTRTLNLVLTVLLLSGLTSCATWDPDGEASLQQEAAETVKVFRARDPGMQRFFDNAYAYAVFPTVGKGGMGIGGAYGEGLVYQNGKPVARTSLTQLTLGLQLGGQAYHEIIFFADRAAFERFKTGRLELSAQLSAVAATQGASADAGYEQGVAVFTLAKGGLMYEASVGGQNFSYEPLK